MTRQNVRVDVEGLSELRRGLRQLGTGADDLKDANQAAARIVATAAQAAAPRGPSGRLSAAPRGNRAVGRAVVTVSTVYAGPVHWGWPSRNIEANPFVADAAQRSESVWLPAYEQALQRLADQVSGA